MEKLTVITVCYNAEENIENTIKSVLAQDYGNLEYVIQDGNSQDATMEIVRRYQENHRNMKVCSEDDSGIFQAMNKAVKHAAGQYVLFMNAGDTFTDSDVVRKAMRVIESHHVDILCGDWNMVYRNQVKHIPYHKTTWFDSFILLTIFSTMAIHQGIFARRELLEKYPFREDYRICADYRWLLIMYRQMFRHKVRLAKINLTVADYDMYGISAKRINIAAGELDRALKEVYPFMFVLQKQIRYRVQGDVLERVRERMLHCL